MASKQERDNFEDDLFDEDDEDTQKDKFLTFRIGDEDYGIEIAFVTEIVGIQKITIVPEMPKYVKGVINLRGQVIPVVDVRLRFHMPERPYDERTCVIVARMGEATVGLVVDTVYEVITIPEASVSAPPSLHNAESNKFIKGMGRVGDSVQILLDIQKLLHEGELEKISASAGA